MRIFVDSDATPRPLKTALCRAAEQMEIEVCFVAAHAPRLPETTWVTTMGAGLAFNGADDWIIDHLSPGDLVITADIPLADRALGIGAEVLNFRGEFFTPENIKNALAMRELLDELRVAGEITGGPAPFSERQRITFINALNRRLQKR